jgi:3-oxoacyl-[acyl-carrier-protein] synthase II
MTVTLDARQVLVTVGTACTLSAIGSTETYQSLVLGSEDFIALAAFDAGLVEFDHAGPGADRLQMRWIGGPEAGLPAMVSEIEARHGAALRRNLGIRRVDPDRLHAEHAVVDIAAGLPHDLEDGGLRRLAGLGYDDIRNSSLRDMHGLFQDEITLAPSLQSQLFAYAGLGALACLPMPLSRLLDNPCDFRVAAATAFPGLDALGLWLRPDAPAPPGGLARDRFAARLASSLGSHGPALLTTMLAPAYSLSRTLKSPELRKSLHSSDPGFMRVPQAPLTAVGACASSLIAFCDIAPQLLFDYPGLRRPQMVLLTAADAALQPRYGILEAFGGGALMTSQKLAAINTGYGPDQQRSVGECLAPFDIDANGTVVGHGGSGLLITTLDFALRNFLDITSIIAGWGQSSEAGGKAHFAGVGFGGENALVQALDMAHQAHGYGVNDFEYLVAHATGTRTNSKSDLVTAAAGRAGAALRQGVRGTLAPMFVATPKALGDGHTMGETGLKAISQALQYLLGKPALGVPTLRRLDPELESVVESFTLQAAPISGREDGGALCVTQGFGGYNGAVALRAAHPEAFARYRIEPAVLAAYLERWPQLRLQREHRERISRLGPKLALHMAEYHCWQGEQS